MGADFYFNPPDADDELWEKVRDQTAELRRLQQENSFLRTKIADRNAEIAALKRVLISLGRTDPVQWVSTPER